LSGDNISSAFYIMLMAPAISS